MMSASKGTFVLAESMERRTGPEGNSEGQSTCHTQDWDGVSHAADRIRRFVRREPRERLTTLLRQNSIDNPSTSTRSIGEVKPSPAMPAPSAIISG